MLYLFGKPPKGLFGDVGRLSVYEVVGDGWQLNVINTHVPFGDATEPFLQALAEASSSAT